MIRSTKILITWILFILVFIPSYTWSTHIWTNFKANTCGIPCPGSFNKNDDDEPFVSKFNDPFLQHTEYKVKNFGWMKMLYQSGVCKLGMYSYYGLISFLFLYLILYSSIPEKKWDDNSKTIKIICIVIWTIVFVVMLFMNFPLFFRSIPAIVIGYYIIILTTTKN
jgi:hypothetical protein